MQNLQFPIDLKFKISSFSNDFTATDSNGQIVAYVRQKMFKLKEDIEIFDSEARATLNYRIKADRWLDFSAAYAFYNKSGFPIGRIVRKGWRSLWKAEYELIDQNDKPQYIIKEDNGWVKVMDGLLGEIPILNFLTGYFFNPTYSVINNSGSTIARLSKQASFWGRQFQITKEGSMDNDDDDRILLGLMMMILLERRRG